MTLKLVVLHLKTIHAGESIGYGRTFAADHEMQIATVPIGYADGFWRANGNERYSVLITRKTAPILGRVCMDQMMVDVSQINYTMGDEVIVFDDSVEKQQNVEIFLNYSK